MTRRDMDAAQVLETFGALLAAVAALAAKVPAAMALPGGIRPAEEDVEKYETAVCRFREQSGATWRALNEFFMASLEAFEAGRVFDVVPPLLQALERVVELHKDGKVNFTDAERARIRDFHRRLEKILPEAGKPEVDLPAPETY